MAADVLTALIIKSRMALGWSQRELGENIGASHRTAARWEAGKAPFWPDYVTKLARRVHAVDRELAVGLARTLDKTLVDLEIEAPPLPPPVNVGAAPVVHATTLADLLDCVVCAVAEAADASPRTVRPLVVLALRRAREVRLDLDLALASGLLAGDAAPTRHPDTA